MAASEHGVELFTLGYEGLTQDRYLDILQAHGVETLVDIRRIPMSRKPGFSKRRLSEACAIRRLVYRHMVDLGTPIDVLHAYRETHSHPNFVLGMSAYLDTKPDAVGALADLAKQSVCCLMCVEADPNLCHRELVAERVQDRIGTEVCRVVDLMG